MKQQNPLTVFILTLVTFGIYSIFWFARTRGEMVRKGADIPTTFLIIIPLANLYYMWKWSQGVEQVTNGKMQWFVAFLLDMALGAIGIAIIQDTFNKVGEGSGPAAPQTPSAQPPSQTPPETPATGYPSA